MASLMVIIMCIVQLTGIHSFLYTPCGALGSPSSRNHGAKCHSFANRQRQSVVGKSSLSKLSVPKLYSTAKDIPVWDKFGRVPYDDWLFTTSRLVDPNLLKRSFVEAVS